jgi:hypothetical protein
MLIDIVGLWKRESKGNKKYLSSGKMTLRDFKMKLQKSFEGLDLDDVVFLNLFTNDNKRNEKAPDANLSLSVKDKPKEQEQGDVPW